MQTPGAEAIGSAKTEIVTRGRRQKSSADTRFDDGCGPDNEPSQAI